MLQFEQKVCILPPGEKLDLICENTHCWLTVMWKSGLVLEFSVRSIFIQGWHIYGGLTLGPAAIYVKITALWRSCNFFFHIFCKLWLRHTWSGRTGCSFTAWPPVQLTIRDPTWCFPQSDISPHTTGTDVAKHTQLCIDSLQLFSQIAVGKSSFKAVSWSSVFENSGGLIKMIKEQWGVQQRL